MKLHRLELEGFGPFLHRQTVDFDAFDEDGLFLISGRTGAGKSSILDGVCFSLYGTTPRYDGGDRGLRSDHCAPADPTEARLEFSVVSGRWRVTRTPAYDRPMKNRAGTTPAKATVLLEQLVDGEWIGRATKYREAAELLDELVGLNRDQFQQVILLAQNRFAEFLLAKNDERQALLRTLFGSRRYEEYERAFEDRRRAAQQAVEADAAALGALLMQAEALIADNEVGAAIRSDEAAASSDTTSARLDAIARAVPRARYRAESAALLAADAATAHDDAIAAFGGLSAQRKLQEERLGSRAALARLEDREPSIADDRRRLDRARTAEALRAPIESAARARTDAARAAELEHGARAAWASAGEQDADPAALRAVVEALTGDLAVWAKAAELERSLPGLEARRRRSDDTVAGLEASIASARDAATARSDRLGALELELSAVEAGSADLGSSKEALAAAAARLESAREAARLAPVADAADERHLAAVTAREAASTTVRALLQRRLDGYAGELASTLIDGEPCLVCGSREHPQPSSPSGEPVTDDAVAAAEAAVDAANRAVTEASDRARAARAEHQSALARAGGESLGRLEALHAEAQLRAEAAATAADLAARLRGEHHELRAAESAAAAERDALTAQLAAALQERATLVHETTATRAAIDAARGEHTAVADRIAEARRRRVLAQALADAADEHRRSEEAAAAAEADRDARLEGSAFADGAEASGALLDPPDQKALDDAIRAHDAAITAERERLFRLETELAGVADEPVALDDAAAAVASAQAAWKESVAAAARAAEVAGQLASAATRAAEAFAASAERAAEFELVAGLANAVAGRNPSRMDLETFVLAAELEEIVRAANLRLEAMSNGRYLLQHTDAVGVRNVASGLGLAVLDSHTGQARPPQSLSGGETFLASLALALGLAQVVTDRAGGVRLDTLFIDEGFGSLDSETLEHAMETLDELRQGGRTVGLISHVETMKERLPAQLIVEATRQGPSRIRQDLSMPV